MTTTKAIGYVRVSTDGQAVDGVSIDAQRAKLDAWAIVNDAELVAVYVDAGLSGGRADNRPELVAALDAACREGAALVVYSLSRLSRSTADTIAIAERLDKANADLVSLSEKIDTTTAAGKMVFRMLAVMAEFERDQVSERTRMAMAHLRQQGRRISGKVPFGFDDNGDGNLIENATEQAALKLIAELHADGLSLRKIAAELTARNVQTKTGAKWSPKVIAGIIDRMEKAA